MVASQKKEIVGVLDFVCQHQTYCFQGPFPSANKDIQRLATSKLLYLNAGKDLYFKFFTDNCQKEVKY